ncbi:hypothetical protein [Rummeliibacillus stabekisii]|uniref:hypothetical protein n=1 Tax=Rummeliibacillus stabekisii TaxID=241244 RepID=UPI0037134944
MNAIVAEDGDPLREKFELKTLHEEIDAKLAENAVWSGTIIEKQLDSSSKI